MSPHFTLHTSLGAMFIGLIFATSLHGISILQAWYYYRHQNDKWPLKSLVAAVMICDTIHEALIAHAVYIYTITNWGNMGELLTLVKSLVLGTLFNGLTTLLVQSFMTVRLWRLSNHNIILTTLTCLIVLAQFGTSLAFTILAVQRKSLIQLRSLKPLTYAIILLAAIGDVLIAVALCVVLHRSRTGFQRSETIINKLIAFTVNTGLLTSLYAVASFIAYMTAPDTFIYFSFYFSVGRLYANAFLATLNGRQMIRGSSEVDTMPNTSDRVTLSLRELSTNGSTSKPQLCASKSSDISININTPKDFGSDGLHDLEQDHEIKTPSSSLAARFEEKPRNV